MSWLDLRTVLVLGVTIYLVCTLFIVQLWWQNRSRFDGTGLWALNFALQTTGLALLSARGAIPDWLSIVLANALMMLGLILFYRGLQRFVGRLSQQRYNFALLALSTVLLFLLTFVHPDLRLRTVVVSIFFLVLFYQCMWLLWYRVEPGQRALTFWVVMVLGAHCVISLIRITEYIFGMPIGNDYLKSGGFQTLVIISYQAMFLLLTYALILMVNQRLIARIGAEEEKFAKAFHFAPYALTLARTSDQTIFDVNETFCDKTGYRRAEVLGKNSIDLQLWGHEEDKAAVVEALSTGMRVRDREASFRKKNGELLTALFSAEFIEVNGKKKHSDLHR